MWRLVSVGLITLGLACTSATYGEEGGSTPSARVPAVFATTLPASDFPYAGYLRAVQRRIAERWYGHQVQGRQPVIGFDISRDGTIARIALERSSGRADYDATALQAVRSASPFPTLPFEYEAKTLTLHLGFGTTGDPTIVTPGTHISRQSVRITDADRGNPLCTVEVTLNEAPSSTWQQHWRDVALRLGLQRAAISRQRLILTFEVARLQALPGLVDKALAATNAMIQADDERAQRVVREEQQEARRKQQYIEELNQRLR